MYQCPPEGHAKVLVVFGTKRKTYFSEWVIRGSGKLQCEAFIGPKRVFHISAQCGLLLEEEVATLHPSGIHHCKGRILVTSVEDYTSSVIWPPCVATQGGYTRGHLQGRYTPPCVATQKIVSLCPPLCRDTWGVYPLHDTGFITRLCLAVIHDTTHNTSSGVNQWS